MLAISAFSETETCLLIASVITKKSKHYGQRKIIYLFVVLMKR